MSIRGCARCLRWLAPLLWSVLAFGAGTAAEPEGYWVGDVNAPVPATLKGATVVHAETLEALLQRDEGAVVIDVSNAPRRPAELAPGAPWMPLAHRALPGALWIPGAGAGAIAPAVEALYRIRLRAAGGLDTPLVIYCHEKCWLSWNAAKRAVAYGYRRVYWFPDGIEGWSAARRPTAFAEPLAPPAEPAAPAAELPRMVVLDLELTGDLGGPDFAAEHDVRVRAQSVRLRHDLERTGMYLILDAGAAQGSIDTLKSRQIYLHDCNGCDLEVGLELHADLVMVAWVDRVSGLILSLTYEIHDVKSGQIAARKSFDFRGDNDNAWTHAIDFMVRDLSRTGR